MRNARDRLRTLAETDDDDDAAGGGQRERFESAETDTGLAQPVPALGSPWRAAAPAAALVVSSTSPGRPVRRAAADSLVTTQPSVALPSYRLDAEPLPGLADDDDGLDGALDVLNGDAGAFVARSGSWRGGVTGGDVAARQPALPPSQPPPSLLRPTSQWRIDAAGAGVGSPSSAAMAARAGGGSVASLHFGGPSSPHRLQQATRAVAAASPTSAIAPLTRGSASGGSLQKGPSSVHRRSFLDDDNDDDAVDAIDSIRSPYLSWMSPASATGSPSQRVIPGGGASQRPRM